MQFYLWVSNKLNPTSSHTTAAVMSFIKFLIALILASLIALPQDTIALPTNGAGDGKQRYIVVLKATCDLQNYMQDFSSRFTEDEADTQGSLGIINGFVADLSSDTLQELASDPDVDYVEKDGIVRAANAQPENWEATV